MEKLKKLPTLLLGIATVATIIIAVFTNSSYAQENEKVEKLELENKKEISTGYKKENAKVAKATARQTSGNFVYEIVEIETSEAILEDVAVITGYIGKETTVTIPSTLGGKKVFEIEEAAFYQNATIKSIIIPDSVANIGPGAFADCINLETVKLGKNIGSIARYAFQRTKLSTIVIPAETSYIDATAFFQCENLTNITVDAKNQSYSSNNGVLFDKAKTVIKLYPYAKKDRTYNIPNTVKTIESNSFINDNIQEINIPASVKSIKTNEFCFTTKSLKTINVDSKNTEYSSQNGVLFSKDKTKLHFYPAGRIENTYTIPNGTKYINSYAFLNSENLKKINIPSTVNEIELGGFSYAKGLEEIAIPSSVTNFGASLFEECPKLKKATISANAELLSYLTFNECPSLEEVIVNGKIKRIIKGAFYYCPNLTKVTLPDSLEKIDFGAFWVCDALENIKIPKNVKEIEECGFYDYRNADKNYWADTKLDISETELRKMQDGSYLATYKYTVKGTRDYTKAYEVLELVNIQRKNAGLKELKMDKELLENAMLRTAETVTLFDHERPSGQQCFTAITKTNYTMAAENIAAYQSTPTEVMNSWMNSQGHRENIMKSEYTSIGIGCYKADNGNYYWVQLFTKGTPTTVGKPQNTQKNETINIKYDRIPFNDVKKTDWAYNSVLYSVKNQMILGTNSTTFSPKTNLTRGMLVTILWRMENSPIVTTEIKFLDVSNKEYYYNAVKWASSKKIVNGYSNGKFGPNDKITRQDLAVILRNYAIYKKKNTNINTDLSKFKDYKDIAPYARTAMQWAVGKGVITGNAGANTLTPKNTSTRAEASSMLYKYCMNVK